MNHNGQRVKIWCRMNPDKTIRDVKRKYIIKLGFDWNMRRKLQLTVGGRRLDKKIVRAEGLWFKVVG